MEQLAQVGPAGIELGGLAQAVGLNKATTHRVLAALRYRDFASQMADGNYVLGPGATQLAPNFYRDENLPELLRPALAALSGAVGALGVAARAARRLPRQGRTAAGGAGLVCDWARNPGAEYCFRPRAADRRAGGSRSGGELRAR